MNEAVRELLAWLDWIQQTRPDYLPAIIGLIRARDAKKLDFAGRFINLLMKEPHMESKEKTLQWIKDNMTAPEILTMIAGKMDYPLSGGEHKVTCEVKDGQVVAGTIKFEKIEA